MRKYRIVEPPNWRPDWIANGGEPDKCPVFTISYPTPATFTLPRDQWVRKEAKAGEVVSDIPAVSIDDLLRQGTIVEVGRPAAAKGEA